MQFDLAFLFYTRKVANMTPVLIDYRHGSSPEGFANLPSGSVGAIVCDPPYGTGGKGVIYGRRHVGAVTGIQNDTDLSQLEASAPEMARVLMADGLALVCCAPTLRRAAEDVLEAGGLNPIHVIVWDKGTPGISYKVRYAHEDIILAVKDIYGPWDTRAPIISPIRVPRVQHTEHPNEKPVALYRKLIRWALPTGGLVLDPFAGIASCGVAAIAERCSYIGVECDEMWWPIASRRLAEARNIRHPDILQESLFGDVA